MSGNDRSEVRAFQELEVLVRHLGEELAVFRRRALSAESQLKGGTGDGASAEHASKAVGRVGTGNDRVEALEAENESLRTRLDRAEDRVRQMMDGASSVPSRNVAGAGRS
jgi:hypothetical protein